MRNIRLSLLVLAAVSGAAISKHDMTTSVKVYKGAAHASPLQYPHEGWMQPEDLPPMPQCIHQQDQSIWLDILATCTSKRCSNHFGVICTRHTWFTELSCLDHELQPAVVDHYLPFCSRSILAMAQLYNWFYDSIGSVSLGSLRDADMLRRLSPASLQKGYAATNVISKAPGCLTEASSPLNEEPFAEVITSCSFTNAAKHSENVAHPWKYDEGSMIVLYWDSTSYDLTGHGIPNLEYFDNDCFCKTFAMKGRPKEACANYDLLQSTRERLWINVICGSSYLPEHWREDLKLLGPKYKSNDEWSWPSCIANPGNKMVKDAELCGAEACRIDSRGFCTAEQAIDTDCFCKKANYQSVGRPCHSFLEGRVEYINWLHDLCGNVEGWHGLPDDWRKLAAPTAAELIPWRWTVKPINSSLQDPKGRPPTEMKIGSLMMFNAAMLVAVLLGARPVAHHILRGLRWYPMFSIWWLRGLLIAIIQVFAPVLSSKIVQASPGYEGIPTIQLALLLSTMPKPFSMITLLLLWVQKPPKAKIWPYAGPPLLADAILQIFASAYIVKTVVYGWNYRFYTGALENSEEGTLAWWMYAGAAVWLWVVLAGLIFLTWIIAALWLTSKKVTRSRKLEYRGEATEVSPLITQIRPDTADTQGAGGSYNTLILRVMIGFSMLLWFAQWIFWSSFVFVYPEGFCPPNLWALTAVWMAASLACGPLYYPA